MSRVWGLVMLAHGIGLLTGLVIYGNGGGFLALPPVLMPFLLHPMVRQRQIPEEESS